MRKLLAALGLLIVIVGAFIFINKFYYPSLPMESISKKEAFEKGNNSDNGLVKLAEESGYEWYIVSKQNISETDELIRETASQHGWTFIQKEGSGLFFEKSGDQLIVSTQQWTSDYLLVKIPANLNK